jgi:hypothetical protein
VNDINGICTGSSCPGIATDFCTSLTSRRSVSLPLALRSTFSSKPTSTEKAIKLWWRLWTLKVPGSNSTSFEGSTIAKRHPADDGGVYESGHWARGWQGRLGGHEAAVVRVGEHAQGYISVWAPQDGDKTRICLVWRLMPRCIRMWIASPLTVLMRAHTSAPSVLSAVCTRQN